jgi:murein L,D-transpeptidase YafK
MRRIAIALLLSVYAVAVQAESADFVRVHKADRKMILYSKSKVLREYRIALGRNPVGHKQQEGDKRTPEGAYVLDYRNPRSAFRKSIHISYPNKQDRDAARRRGVAPGGMIMIHGAPNAYAGPEGGVLRSDWTDGCIALMNREMDEVWRLVPDGTPIEIEP